MMPNMKDAIFGFSVPAQFAVVSKKAEDFEAVESAANVLGFIGTFVPIPPRVLQLKPEGERKWKWWTLYSTIKLDLDWVVMDRNKKVFRVMSDTDYSQAGFFGYELAEKPLAGGSAVV